jgi:hypothetical protein
MKLLQQNDRSDGGPAVMVARPSAVLHQRPERTCYDLVQQQVSAPVALLSAITSREVGRSSSSGYSARSSANVAAASASYVGTNTLEFLAQQKGCNLF